MHTFDKQQIKKLRNVFLLALLLALLFALADFFQPQKTSTPKAFISPISQPKPQKEPKKASEPARETFQLLPAKP